MNRVQIAAIAHNLNAAICAALGEVQPPWAQAPEWQKQSALAGVDMHLNNPDATPEQSHESWMAQKVADGWVYGEVKDAEKKTHPCMRPYAELPEGQKIKDHVFRAVVHQLKAVPDAPAAGDELLKPAGVAPRLAAGFVPVKYVGKRETYRDGLYQTGITFTRGETKLVPADKARLMLNHPDQYVPGEAAQLPTVEAPPAASTQAETDKQEEQAQDVRDQVSRMDKDALVEFAKVHYRADLDKRRSVETLRGAVTQLVDRFGVQ